MQLAAAIADDRQRPRGGGSPRAGRRRLLVQYPPGPARRSQLRLLAHRLVGAGVPTGRCQGHRRGICQPQRDDPFAWWIALGGGGEGRLAGLAAPTIKSPAHAVWLVDAWSMYGPATAVNAHRVVVGIVGSGGGEGLIASANWSAIDDG